MTELSCSKARGPAAAKAGQAGIRMKRQGSPTSGADQSGRSGEYAPRFDSLSTVLALIEKIALDPCVDLEKLERMMTMFQRLKGKEAELAYNAKAGS